MQCSDEQQMRLNCVDKISGSIVVFTPEISAAAAQYGIETVTVRYPCFRQTQELFLRLLGCMAFVHIGQCSFKAAFYADIQSADPEITKAAK